MSFCWESRDLLSALDQEQLLLTTSGGSRKSAFLVSQLQSQYGILTEELVPFVASHLRMPPAAENLKFSQILEYKQLLEVTMEKQLSFLNDTGVKLEAYYSTLPSGEILSDRQIEETLCSCLFEGEAYEPSLIDVSTPASSMMSSIASPMQTFSSMTKSPRSRGLKSVGAEFRSAIDSDKDQPVFPGFQKHNPGRDKMSPIRELSEEICSPGIIQQSKRSLSQDREQRSSSTDGNLKHWEENAYRSVSSSRDSTSSSTSLETQPGHKNGQNPPTLKLETKHSSESLQRDSSKPPDANPRTDVVTMTKILPRPSWFQENPLKAALPPGAVHKSKDSAESTDLSQQKVSAELDCLQTQQTTIPSRTQRSPGVWVPPVHSVGSLLVSLKAHLKSFKEPENLTVALKESVPVAEKTTSLPNANKFGLRRQSTVINLSECSMSLKDLKEEYKLLSSR